MPQSQNPEPDPGWDAFLAGHADEIQAAATRVCPRNAGIAADELAQEIRLRLWKALPNAKTVTDPTSYIRRVAATAAIDAVRKARSRKEEPLHITPGLKDGGVAEEPATSAPESSPERVAASHELAQKLESALAGLLPSRQRPVRLYLQGFSSTEAAVLLGWSEPRTRTLLYRGLDELREDLRRQGIRDEPS